MRIPLILALAIMAAACARPASPDALDPAPAFLIPADWPLFAHTVSVSAPRTMVTSVHPRASEAGVIILRKGGNAVDAAVATGFALAVVHPSAGNIGGGGFMVARLADGQLFALDYRETAPGRATRDMYLDSLGHLTDRSVTGHLAAGVPGSVAGLVAAQDRHGLQSLAALLSPPPTVA